MPDHTKCVTVRDDPNTPEDEFYESSECAALSAYRECISKCGGDEEVTCFILCMKKEGAYVDKEMDLTVSTDKNTYAPRGTVIVQGSVKDAEGNAIPDVSFVIEVEGIDISTLSGTMYDVTCCGGQFNLPKDVSEGIYTVKVTASKTGYPDVSETTSFTVGQLKIEVEGNYKGVAADGISELRFIVEFPKGATNPRCYYDSDDPQPNCKLVKIVSNQLEKMEIKFKPREEIKKPYNVTVNVTVDMPPNGQQLTAYKEIQVVRPPVVLIHGIWSNSRSMMPLCEDPSSIAGNIQVDIRSVLIMVPLPGVVIKIYVSPQNF